MARTAADLALTLDVISGPEDSGYRLELPPARRKRLGDFRILVVDAHPLAPTASVVREALASLIEKLARAGATVSERVALLPDLAEAARLQARLMSAYWGAGLPRRAYERRFAEADAFSPRDHSLAAERARGVVMSYREWLDADAARMRLRREWRELFREWDIVMCPAAPTLAFPHDHSTPLESRRLRIDRKSFAYIDAQLVWATLATTPGLPATVAPIGAANGLPIGAQFIGPYLEDRTPIAFAELLAREFGGFTPPLL
jgi:amidase